MVHLMHRKSDEERIDYFFTARHWQGQIKNTEPHKCDDLTWYDFNHLPDNIIPYIKAAFQNYKNNQVFSHFGWEERK